MALVVTEADRAVFYGFDSLASVFGVYFVLGSYELLDFIGALGVWIDFRSRRKQRLFNECQEQES